MDTRICRMEGTSHFYTFAYLRQAAWNAFDTAKAASKGSNYHRVSAVLFASLTIEAYLNHLGERAIPNWDSIERKIRWREKLERVAQELDVQLDIKQGWGQTAIELFSFRNKLAHGKTHDRDAQYKHREGGSANHSALDPQWLRKYWNDDAVQRVLAHLDDLLKEFQSRAGLDPCTLNLISEDELTEFERSPRM